MEAKEVKMIQLLGHKEVKAYRKRKKVCIRCNKIYIATSQFQRVCLNCHKRKK